MSATLKRWSLAIAVAGVVTGGTAGLTAQTEVAPPAGCSCTISGGGSYACASTSSCGAGTYSCSANCN